MMGAFRSRGWYHPTNTSFRLVIYNSCIRNSTDYIRRIADAIADTPRFRIVVVVNRIEGWNSQAHTETITETALGLLRWLIEDTRVSIKLIIRFCTYDEERDWSCRAEYNPNEIYNRIYNKVDPAISEPEAQFLRHSGRLRIVSELQSDDAEDQGEQIERYRKFRF